MATIYGESNDKTVTATYDKPLVRIYAEDRLIRFDSCNLQAVLEALENLKNNIISTYGDNGLK